MGWQLPYTITTVTAATGAPVTPQEVKDHTYIDTDLQDNVIQRQINAASRLVEIQSRRQLMYATFDMNAPHFPCDRKIPLPKFPVGSVTHVKYYDANNTQQTLASSDYTVNAPTDSLGYIELLPKRS